MPGQGLVRKRGRDRGCLGAELAQEGNVEDFRAQALAGTPASGQGQYDSLLNGVLGLGALGLCPGFKGDGTENLQLEGQVQWYILVAELRLSSER